MSGLDMMITMIKIADDQNKKGFKTGSIRMAPKM